MSETTVPGAQYLYQIAEAIGQREDGIGGPSPDGPTSEELRNAAAMLDRLLKAETDGSMNVSLLWDTIQCLAETSDKWIDPETDPLGAGVREFLENGIHAMAEVLNENLPQNKETYERWANLRVVRHCAQREVHRQKMNPPIIKTLWNRLFSR